VPCVIFFDEFDALAPHRNSEQSEASARVVNTLLTELDGLSTREGIYMVAATNRPDMIDSAMLRPGRLETLLYVQLPKPAERVNILKALIQKTPHDPSLAQIAGTELCKDLSGADLSALLRSAAQNCLWQNREVVQKEDIELAARNLNPSVGDVKRYEMLRNRFETKRF
jgi:ribosome biogenesis ATPase